MDNSLKNFIEQMPKIELHLHLEGSLEPELAFKLAKRHGVTLHKKDGSAYKDAAELKAAYKFADLGEFLKLYYQGMNVLRTKQDFKELTTAYLEKVAAQNVKHVEVFFDPQGHTSRGVAFKDAIEGIHEALAEGEKKFGVSSKLIMSFLRDKDEKDAFKTLDQAKDYMGMIDGIGLDSYETPFPPKLFERVFAEAKKRHPHLKLMAHAGEEGPAAFVSDALDVLKVDRIDHGNHSLDNPALVQRLIAEQKGLTVCPMSNLRLCHTLDFASGKKLTDMKDHPLKKMLDQRGQTDQDRLKISIHSDDPAYFRTDEGNGGYMNENFIAVADALNLTRDDIIQLAQNAIDTSFLSAEQKAQKTQELNAYVVDFVRKEPLQQFINSNPGQQRGVA